MYFMSINATFAVAAHTRKVSRRPCTSYMGSGGNNEFSNPRIDTGGGVKWDNDE